MAMVETERHGDVVVIRMNRPEKRNALNRELLTGLAEAWCDFRDSPSDRIAILTGTGTAFSSGEDLVEAAERGTPGFDPDAPFDPFWNGANGPSETIDKPIIAAVNGWAMGGGFLMAWMCDLRVAEHSATFEISEARHWLLGSYKFGFTDTLPWSVATELSLGFPMSAARAYEIGFVNRLADPGGCVDVALEMCDHLLSLPPASLKNTLRVARLLHPKIPEGVYQLGLDLKSAGNVDDIMEARRAFATKRTPVFKGF